MNTVFHYDVVVIGAGHAGCEAAHAAARMGAKTCLITMDMNKIDALGGLTGVVTDATAIQFRMLNRSKGPAMWSPRAQCDRMRFIQEWRKHLENTDNLHIWQDEATEILTEQGAACGVRTIWGAELRAKAVVVTAGTFLRGLMHIGRKQVPFRSHENGYAGAHRQTVGAFGGNGGATGRNGLPPFFVHLALASSTPTSVLDVRNECRGSRNAA